MVITHARRDVRSERSSAIRILNVVICIWYWEDAGQLWLWYGMSEVAQVEVVWGLSVESGMPLRSFHMLLDPQNRNMLQLQSFHRYRTKIYDMC